MQASRGGWKPGGEECREPVWEKSSGNRNAVWKNAACVNGQGVSGNALAISVVPRNTPSLSEAVFY